MIKCSRIEFESALTQGTQWNTVKEGRMVCRWGSDFGMLLGITSYIIYDSWCEMQEDTIFHRSNSRVRGSVETHVVQSSRRDKSMVVKTWKTL